MKFIIVAAIALVAVAAALPVSEEKPELVAILRSESIQDPEGGYSFGFETEDGVKRDETGILKEALDEDNKPRKVVVVSGSFSYINSEGNPETISYTADENGFHPEGASIPVAPAARR